jgi:predicted Holliday junction resolvase-like endonuclease
MFGRLLWIMLVILVVYNTWQVWALRKEVAEIQKQVVSVKAERGSAEEDAHRNSLIDKARLHADEARKDILKGDFNGGKAELDKSMQLLQKAGSESVAPATGALDKAQRSLDQIKVMIDKFVPKSSK